MEETLSLRVMGPDRFQRTYLYCVSIYLYIFTQAAFLPVHTHCILYLMQYLPAFSMLINGLHISLQEGPGLELWPSHLCRVYIFIFSKGKSQNTPIRQVLHLYCFKKKTSTTPEGDFVRWITAQNTIKKLLLTKIH